MFGLVGLQEIQFAVKGLNPQVFYSSLNSFLNN